MHRYALVKRWETRVFWWIPNCYLPPCAPKSRNLSLVYLYCYQAFIFLQPAWYAASAFRGRIYGPKIILFYAGSRCRKKSKTNWLLVLAPIVLRWPSLTQGRFGFWAFLRAKSNESKRPLLMPIRSLMITLCCSLVRNGWMRSTRLAVLLCHILRVCGRTELLRICRIALLHRANESTAVIIMKKFPDCEWLRRRQEVWSGSDELWSTVLSPFVLF